MRKFLVIAAALLTLALVSQWIRLPLIHQGIWMSPDETANVLTAVNFAERGSFAVSYPLVNFFEWAVPRSFVGMPSLSGIAKYAKIVPIGFLGMPLVLAIAFKIFGVYGLLFLTALVALATLWPLWASLPKKWNEGAKWSVLLAWVSFPTVIIYANRGAFGNLFLTCLAIWIWWLLTYVKTIWRWPVAGILLGLAMMIRPPEAIWLLPMVVFAVLSRSPLPPLLRGGFKTSHTVLFLIPLIITLAFGAALGFQTYEKLFVSGYQIRITKEVRSTGYGVQQDGSDVLRTSYSVQSPEAVSVFKIVSIGLHPRNIAWNVWQYIIILFWPWTLVCIVATIIAIRDKIWQKQEWWVTAAFVWTTTWLIIFYGNGVYQDHVGVNVASMGNSFLRYLLPLSVVAAVSAGYVFERLWKNWSLKILGVCMVILLVGLGQWYAIYKDDEGIAANEKELVRYAEIRDEARAWLDPATVVVSDRSDKVFFPIFQSVSPLPDDNKLKDLIESGYSVALFLQTQTDDRLAQWQDRGFDLSPAFSNGNQTMYNVTR